MESTYEPMLGSEFNLAPDKWYVVRCENGMPTDILPIPFTDKALAQLAIDTFFIPPQLH
jgi:hypothetical protein